MTKIFPIPAGDGSGIATIKPAFTYADLIVAYLSQIEVEYIFGIPGGAIEGLFDALARSANGESPPESIQHFHRALERKERRLKKSPRLVLPRHEAGGAFMADGYARETGKLGVCCSTTGPGATNLLTGVANAYVDKIPMLVITPQTALTSFGQRAFQESSGDLVDVVSIFNECTRYSSLVSHPEQLEGKLCTALSTAFRHPRGPVHLSIPADILSLPVRSAAAQFNVATLLREPIAVDDDNYRALLNAIENSRIKSKSITLFMGEDCGESAEEIVRFAEIINAKIVTSPAGKRWINAYHPQYCGVFGFAGHSSARAALTDSDVDLVLAIGTSLGELDTAGWDSEALLNDRLVHIAPSMSNFDRSPMAYLHVYGNLSTLFNQLLRDLHKNYSVSRRLLEDGNTMSSSPSAAITGLLPTNIELVDADKCLSDALPIKPQRLMLELVKHLPDSARYVVDTGNAWSWATHYMQLKGAKCFHIAMGFGAMGWAVGAAIGVALSDSKTPVVCLTGDGSYLMSSQEITVAVAEQLPVIYVILNDQALGMVKHGQILNKAEEIGIELPPVDFAAMARSVGVKAYSIKTWADFNALHDYDFKKMTGPILLDVHIDGDELPPIKSRLKVLSKAKHGSELGDLETAID